MKKLLDCKELPTAVMAVNDFTAIGAIVGVGVAAGTVTCTVAVAQAVGVATVQI